MLVVRHPAYLVASAAAASDGTQSGPSKSAAAAAAGAGVGLEEAAGRVATLEALFVFRRRLGFSAAVLHEEVAGLSPLSLRAKLAALGVCQPPSSLSLSPPPLFLF